MTSKTFKSTATNRTLTVEGHFNGEFAVVFSDDSSLDLMLQGGDAPALALAILEAAGVKGTSTGGLITHDRVAVTNLKIHIEKQAKRTAEAKEQAKLEAEALELLNAEREEFSCTPVRDLSEVPARDQRAAIAVARRARELAKEATK
ncbi:hypothetical protein [Glutamicibacter protophormiae]|uniref:hypothetical protein n=1 Tax=Glutamicibacter protophormiae TaxID=37930 RepID=UPI003A949C59